MSRTPSRRAGTLALSSALFAFATLAGCGSSGDDAPASTAATTSPSSTTTASATAGAAASTKSIVAVAQGDARFTSLVAALQFASDGGDLVNLLAGAGTFTVFAPTNDAFDALARELTGNASATATDLLVPANKALVRAVLQYHVLGATVRKAQVPLGQPIDPVLAGGDTFSIDLWRGDLLITDGRLRTAKIVLTDVAADNGVIHAIDKVILPPEATPSRSLAQVAAGNARYTSLVAALGFASDNGDLVTLLSAPGRFTVFAPTNDAFDALARELTHNAHATAADLLVPANKALVRAVLQYHVLASTVKAADIQAGLPVTPALGGDTFFRIETEGGARIVDGRGREAKIVRTDVAANNGVLHAIDRVILPADKSIVALAASLPQFSSLVAALQFASENGDLVSLLSAPGRFTVFAPTNDAFDALARELTHNAHATAADLLVPANKALVRAVLQYHVLGDRVLKAQVPLGQPIDPVLAGHDRFTVTAPGGQLTVTDARHRSAKIVATDVAATNGVVHVIDTVILPAP